MKRRDFHQGLVSRARSWSRNDVTSSGRQHPHVPQAPSQREFDFIIIGAGLGRLRARQSPVGGCVDPRAAARGRRARQRRPRDHDARPLGLADRLAVRLGLRDRAGSRARTTAGSPFRAARCYGGSSAINAMTFIRGHQFCFDRWERRAIPAGATTTCCRCSRSPSATRWARRRIAAPTARSRCRSAPIRMPAISAFLAAASQHGYKADARFDFNLPLARERRRLLPEEHSGRQAAQRRRRVPDAGAGAAEPRGAIAARRPPG